MAKRQKTGKTLALFDVDGTLTIPRKVRRARWKHPGRDARSTLRRREVYLRQHTFPALARRARPAGTRTALTLLDSPRNTHSRTQKADETMLKFMKDLQEVRRHSMTTPCDAQTSAQSRPQPFSFMGTSAVSLRFVHHARGCPEREPTTPSGASPRVARPSSARAAMVRAPRTRRSLTVPRGVLRCFARRPTRRRKSPSASSAVPTW